MPTPSIIELPSARYVWECVRDREPRGGAHVYNVRGTHFPVTNLGWLLRHANDVHDFVVRTYALTPGHNVNYDVILAARLVGGGVYVTEFADRRVLKDWLDRPRFRDVPIWWNHRAYIIGSRDYRELEV